MNNTNNIPNSDNRDMYYGGYSGVIPLNMMNPNMMNPNMMLPYNNINNYNPSNLDTYYSNLDNRITRIENQIKSINQRLTRLEAPYNNTTNNTYNTYNNEPDSNMYIM